MPTKISKKNWGLRGKNWGKIGGGVGKNFYLCHFFCRGKMSRRRLGKLNFRFSGGVEGLVYDFGDFGLWGLGGKILPVLGSYFWPLLLKSPVSKNPL